MALTEDQKKWLVGGSIGAVALFIGYEIFGSRPAFAQPALPFSSSRDEHVPRRHKRRRSDDREHEANARGEYGRKKKHHHRGRKHD